MFMEPNFFCFWSKQSIGTGDPGRGYTLTAECNFTGCILFNKAVWKRTRLQINVSTGFKEVRCFFQDSLPSHQIKIMSSTELPTLNNITFMFCCCVMLWRSVPWWWSLHTWYVRDHLWCNWQEESWFYSWLLLVVGEIFRFGTSQGELLSLDLRIWILQGAQSPPPQVLRPQNCAFLGHV